MRALMVFVIVSLSTLLVTFQDGRAQGNFGTPDILQHRVPGDELEYKATTDVFYSTLGRLGFPGGMVRLVTCGQEPSQFAWRPQGAPLGQVLNDLVTVDPRYRWEMKDGVVNLLPASGEPTLLGTRLSKFDIEDVSSPSRALNQILSLPQVKKSMHDLTLKPGLTLVKSLSTPHPPRFSVLFNGGTLRQALNAIAHAQGHAIWEYVEVRCDGRNEVVIRF